MILNDLFEGRMKDIDIEYQDFLNSRGRNAMTDKQFQQAYGMTRTEWAKKNQAWTQQKERRPVAPDSYLFHEGAMKDLHTELAEKYRELAPKIEKYKDSFLAGQLYDALEAIAIEHSAELEFKRMMTGARNRAHMDYDTNPGGFQNWFWYLPFADEQDVTEESQDDRNARIIAGEIEDARDEGNEKVAQEKIKKLTQLGYYFDKQGRLQRMGMYEQSTARERWNKASAQREKKHDAIEKEMKARHARGEEDMKGSIDRLEKALTKPVTEGIPFDQCPNCGGSIVHESQITEKQDACYHKVKSRYKVWPSAYASGALVQCRKKGAANWGTGGKKK
jgi:hypothetical protein